MASIKNKPNTLDEKKNTVVIPVSQDEHQPSFSDRLVKMPADVSEE